jgi:hypothetical protein
MIGNTRHAIGALVSQLTGFIMLFAAIVPFTGWLIAAFGSMLLFGNMIYAVVTVANSQQAVKLNDDVSH